MERCSVIRRAIETVRGHVSPELIGRLEILIKDEEEAIKTAYQDGVDFVYIGVMMDDKIPTPEEYVEDLFSQ